MIQDKLYPNFTSQESETPEETPETPAEETPATEGTPETTEETPAEETPATEGTPETTEETPGKGDSEV